MTAILVLVALESLCRFRVLGYLPLSLRLMYASFLMSRDKQVECKVLNQRVYRGGFENPQELFDHYARISGKSPAQIAQLHRPGGGLWAMFRSGYISGMHGLVKERLRMHLGKGAAPNQALSTVTIDEYGRRSTIGADGRCDKPDDGGSAGQSNTQRKICVVLGGSVAFGLGSTGDEYTIPARLRHYLRQYLGEEYDVYNYGYLGFTSYQELLTLLQCEVQPDLVVAISGWNDIDQRISHRSPVSPLVANTEYENNLGAVRRLVGSLVARSELLRIARRFTRAYRRYDGDDTSDYHRYGEIYPMF